MPWDKKDYPNSFKNFEPVLRKKAIDIGNALLAEGYPEDRAIPIAVSQAKEWLENVSDSEKRKFEEEPYPKKKDKHSDKKINQDLLDNDVLVYFKEERWQIRTKGAKRASDSFSTKKEAVDRAREIAENKESKVVTYNKGEQP